MNIGFTALLLLTLVSIFAVGTYWVLVYPVLRRKMAYNIENNLDELRMMGLKGDVTVSSKSYVQVRDFLLASRQAALSGKWLYLRPMSTEDQKAHEIAIRELIDDRGKYTPEVNDLVEDTVRNLFGLYVIQRPMIFCVLMPIVLMSFWIKSARAVRERKELEYAAASLSAACPV